MPRRAAKYVYSPSPFGWKGGGEEKRVKKTLGRRILEVAVRCEGPEYVWLRGISEGWVVLRMHARWIDCGISGALATDVSVPRTRAHTIRDGGLSGLERLVALRSFVVIPRKYLDNITA